MRYVHTAGAVLLAAAAILATPGAVTASARADKTLRLRQDTPVTAASRAGGTCPVPADKDGWHFTLAEAPQNVEFRSVTVTFDNGGTWTADAAGRDAYVASERGASLTGATAVVDGSLLALPLVRHFDLAGTCPGQAPLPVPAPVPPAPVPPAEEQPPVEAPLQDGAPRPGEDEPRPADPKPKDDDGRKPSASPTPAVSATDATPPPELGDGPDQPRLHVNTEEGATPVPAAADEPSGGLGVPGFALLALGVFLLVFGGAAGYLTLRRRGA